MVRASRRFSSRLVAVALGVAALAGASPSTARASAVDDLEIQVVPQLALPGQVVKVTVINHSATDTYTLPSSCVFGSVHPKGCDSDPVAAFGCLTVITPIAPGQALSQTWDQRDSLGQQVPDGGYHFPVTVSDATGKKTDFCPFVQVGLSCSAPPNAYGAGGAGSGGKVPAISSAGGYPAVGSFLFDVYVTNGLGGAAAMFFVGFKPAALPASWGTFLIDPTLPMLQAPVVLLGTPGIAGEGYEHVNVPIPNNSGLLGLELYFQALIADPGSKGGISHSEGLRAVICQ